MKFFFRVSSLRSVSRASSSRRTFYKLGALPRNCLAKDQLFLLIVRLRLQIGLVPIFFKGCRRMVNTGQFQIIVHVCV